MKIPMMKLKKNQKHFLFALDIGSKKMTLAAAELEGTGQIGQIFIETQISQGIFKGVVNDLATLSESVSRLVKKMEARLGTKAVQVALSINGNYIQSRHSTTAIALSERGTRSISRRDIDRLNRQAKMLGLELDEHLLHEYPQGYSIDRHNMTLNPLGLHGRKFEVDLLLICAPAGYVDNIVKAVEQAGLDVVDVVFAGIAASTAVLSTEDKEKGAVFVDIGDTLTGVLLFKDGVVRHVNVLSFGGRHIDEIIANYCRVPIDMAGEIKESTVEIGHDIPETEEAMIKTEQAYRPINKKELAAVVAPEIDKFISLLKSVIFDSVKVATPGMPMVVTGGLSSLDGLLEKMETELGLSARLGIAKGVPEVPASKTPAFASAIGLLHVQKEIHRNAALLFQTQGRNKVEKILDYVSNLYQDYF